MVSATIRHTLMLRRKWLLGAMALMLLYTLAGFFLAPAILKLQLEGNLSDALHRNVAVQTIRINPYVLSLRIIGVQVTELDGQPFASFDDLYVNLQLSSLFQGSWNFKEINLVKPAVAITMHEGGKTNFDDLLMGSDKAARAEQPKPPRIRIETLQIRDGELEFDDFTRSPTFQTRAHPIQLTLTQFSTNPDSPNPYSFLARTEGGGMFSWDGTFSVNPLRSSGNVVISGVELKHFGSYYADFARFQVVSGEMGLRGHYHLDGAASPLALQIDHLTMEVHSLTFHDPDTREAIMTLSSLTVNEAGIDLTGKVASVESLVLTDGSFLARRRRDGSLNLAALANAGTGRDAEPEASGQKPHTKVSMGSKTAWRLTVKEIKLVNVRVDAEDDVPPTPARMTLDRIHMKLNGLEFPDRRPIAAEGSLRWNESGTISASGTLRHSPISADLHIAVSQFDLRPLQPYLDERVALQLTSGTADLDGHVAYGSPEPRAPLIRLTGEGAFIRVAATENVSSQPFVAWDRIAFRGVRADLSPTDLSIDELRVKKLRLDIAVQPDGRSNLTKLVRQGSLDADSEPEHSPRKTRIDDTATLSIKTVVFEDSAVSLTDRSIDPHFSTEIRHLAGRVSGLTSSNSSKATVDLAGRLDKHAPLHITGRVDPFGSDLFVDLVFSVKSYDLPPLSPYAARFAGYPLQRGKLSADLRYKVAEHKLNGENVMLVDHLTLGPHVDSPDATSLPVKLAVAILQDRQGKIHLDVPVSGNLNDPEFRLGKVIWSAFLNILGKVATSPFALLGAVVGGGEELKFIDFDPGEATLTEAATQKLDRLVRALVERPGLTLEITGLAHSAEDHVALAKHKIRRSLQQRKTQTLRATNPALIEEVPLQDREYEQLVRLAYIEASKQTASSNASPPGGAGTSLSPEEEQSSGFWNFLSRLNPFKSDRRSKQDRAEVSAQAATAGLTLAAMESSLIDRQVVTAEDVNALRRNRASAVQSYLLHAGEFGEERLFLVTADSPDGSAGEDSKVMLSLK